MKLDTYLQKVELGERLSAIGGREIARLYSRHQSSAAYILSREGAARYLELTASASQPADYALFPNTPRRLGLQHLSARSGDRDSGSPSQGRQTLRDRDDRDRRQSRGGAVHQLVGKLGRESVRLAGQVASLGEWTYQKAFLRVETTTVGLE